MNKRGLSDVVTTVLIILLVVVAVAAVWAFISPTLKNTGTAIDKGQICLNNKVEVLNCIKVNASGQEAYNVAYRAVYSSDSILGVNQSAISLENEDGSISEVTRIKSMQNGDSTNLAIISNKIAEKIVVSNSFLLTDGTTKTCASVPVSCVSPATIGYTNIWGVPAGKTVPSNNWCDEYDLNHDLIVDTGDVTYIYNEVFASPKRCVVSNNFCGLDFDNDGILQIWDYFSYADLVGDSGWNLKSCGP